MIPDSSSSILARLSGYSQTMSPPHLSLRLAHELRIPAELATQAAEIFGRYSEGEGQRRWGCSICIH